MLVLFVLHVLHVWLHIPDYPWAISFWTALSAAWITACACFAAHVLCTRFWAILLSLNNSLHSLNWNCSVVVGLTNVRKGSLHACAELLCVCNWALVTNLPPQSVHSKVGKLAGPYFLRRLFSTKLSNESAVFNWALVVFWSDSHQAWLIWSAIGGRFQCSFGLIQLSLLLLMRAWMLLPGWVIPCLGVEIVPMHPSRLGNLGESTVF